MKSTSLLIVTGLSAGFFNGLLGAGGGILIVFSLTYLLSRNCDSARDVFANALAVMLPLSTVSLISYIIAGRIDASGFSVYAIPAAIGGLAGAFLLDRINIGFLKKIFAVIVIWSGVYMIIRS